MRRPAAGIRRARNVDGGAALLDKDDFALLVNDERSTIGYASFRHQDAVRFGCLAGCEIAQEWKRKGKLLGKFT